MSSFSLSNWKIDQQKRISMQIYKTFVIEESCTWVFYLQMVCNNKGGSEYWREIEEKENKEKQGKWKIIQIIFTSTRKYLVP